MSLRRFVGDHKLVEVYLYMQKRNKHHDVIKWKHFPRYWPLLRGINQCLVDSPKKGQWRGALMFSSICTWTSGWTNNRDAGDFRHHRHDVTVMIIRSYSPPYTNRQFLLKTLKYSSPFLQENTNVFLNIYLYIELPIFVVYPPSVIAFLYEVVCITKAWSCLFLLRNYIC